MIYSLSSGRSYLQHIELRHDIEASGRRTQAVVHRGLLALATSQAKAMQSMEGRLSEDIAGVESKLHRVSGEIARIDDTLVQQSAALKTIQRSIERFADRVDSHFREVHSRLDDIEDKLDDIDYKVSHPEEARAWERFRTAQTFVKRGDSAEALERVDIAIANDGGPSFKHIPAFQVLRGDLLLGLAGRADPSIVDPAAALEAYLEARKSIEYHKHDVSERIGLAYYALGDLEKALDYLTDAARIPLHRSKGASSSALRALGAALLLGNLEEATNMVGALLDMQWKNVALIASDPDCMAHAEVLEPILAEQLDIRRKAIQPALDGIRQVFDFQQLQASFDRSKSMEVKLDYQTRPNFSLGYFLVTQEQVEKIIAVCDPDSLALDVQEVMNLEGYRDFLVPSVINDMRVICQAYKKRIKERHDFLMDIREESTVLFRNEHIADYEYIREPKIPWGEVEPSFFYRLLGKKSPKQIRFERSVAEAEAAAKAAREENSRNRYACLAAIRKKGQAELNELWKNVNVILANVEAAMGLFENREGHNPSFPEVAQDYFGYEEGKWSLHWRKEVEGVDGLVPIPY